MARKANWAAVSATAAAASALVAFLAYTAPHSPSPPNPLPAPATSRESPPYATPPQTSPGPTLAQPAGPPAGCQQGKAAITRYDNAVGSTPYSKAQAASRAEQDIYMTSLASGGSGTITEDLQALSQDFANLAEFAQGPYSAQYNTVSAQTQKDIQALDTDCNATG